MSETKRARKIALVGDCLAGGGAEKVQAGQIKSEHDL